MKILKKLIWEKSKKYFTYASSKKGKNRGHILFSAAILIFIMAYLLRWGMSGSLHEANINNMFIQETQGSYLLENLMALGREYAYQITCQAKMPNIFLSGSCYRKKTEQGLIDFNQFYSREQIIPKDFPWQALADETETKEENNTTTTTIKSRGIEIFAGPVKWNDCSYGFEYPGTRHRANVLLCGTIKTYSYFMNDNWDMHMVQKMEIERIPLSDFGLYIEGDFNYFGHEYVQYDSLYLPIQINGMYRQLQYTKNDTIYKNGSKLVCNHRISYAGEYRTIPNKDSDGKATTTYPANDEVASALENRYGCYNQHSFFKEYKGFKHVEPYVTSLIISIYGGEAWCVTNSRSYLYNREPRARMIRPQGFDPINDWTPASMTLWCGGNYKQNTVIQTAFGEYNLICNRPLHSVGAYTSNLYSHKSTTKTGYQNHNNTTADVAYFQTKRNLNFDQAWEKFLLCNAQSLIKQPCYHIHITRKTTDNTLPILPMHFPYASYLKDTYPLFLDQIHLKNYYSLINIPRKLSGSPHSIISNVTMTKTVTTENTKSNFTAKDDNLVHDNMWYAAPKVINGKLKLQECKVDTGTTPEERNFYSLCASQTKGIVRPIDAKPSTTTNTGTTLNWTSYEKSATAGSYSDWQSPPSKILYNETAPAHWDPEDNATVSLPERYVFFFDRNRSKWVQCLVIDVSKIASSITKDNFNACNNTICISCYKPASDTTYEPTDGTNYYNYTNSSSICKDYVTNRRTFFASYSTDPNDTSNYYNYTYYSNQNYPFVDLGVLLINCETLPHDGLSIVSSAPLYIKGNFNTKNDSYTVNQVARRKKAFIAADSITVLSNYWCDWASQFEPGSPFLRYRAPGATETGKADITLHATVMTGSPHPYYWDSQPDGNADVDSENCFAYGYHVIRSLELNVKNVYVGRLLIPYCSRYAWEPPVGFWDYINNRRTPSTPAIFLKNTKNKTLPTPNMPYVYKVHRGNQTRMIGDSTYRQLLSDYNSDYDGDQTYYPPSFLE